VKVLLNHPVREVEVKGPRRVKELLQELSLLPEAVLVVRGDDLVTEDDMLRDEDRVEIRPVMSGG
jgi:sulfur carrier protein